MENDQIFEASAYPNPFENLTTINTNTTLAEVISIHVYDMTGKLIENREVNQKGFGNITLGDRYPSGIYNVIVSQGSDLKLFELLRDKY